MRRLLAAAAALALGLGAGIGVTTLLQAEGAEPLPPIATAPAPPAPASSTPVTEPIVVDSAASTTATTLPPEPGPPPTAAIEDRLLLVWTSGGLPARFAERVAAVEEVDAVTVVRGEAAALVRTWDTAGVVVDSPADGFVIPFEVMAFDPETYVDFVPATELAAFAKLGPGEMLLSETSARLRRIGAGGSIELDGGARYTIAGVVADVLVGAAEGAVSDGTAVSTERYLLVRYRGQRDAVEATIRGQLPAGTPARIRSPGETPVLRHGDAVLPQVYIKELFGEFSYRPESGREFTQERAWGEANIASFEVPFLGTVRCHRALEPALRGALEELQRSNLGFLIDPASFRGCHNPRFIGSGRGISRHAWGVAIDLSFSADPEVQAAAQDPRLIDVMARWGFVSGHEWLVPDAGHFEYVRPPAP